MYIQEDTDVTIAMTQLEDVLYLKFQQHPDLRDLLINTGSVDIIYIEAKDNFFRWGPTGDGSNELGKALMRVRQRCTTAAED